MNSIFMQQNKLLKKLREGLSGNTKLLLSCLHLAHTSATTENSDIILAFLMYLQESQIVLEPFYTRSFNFHVSLLKKRFLSNIKPDLQPYVQYLREISHTVKNRAAVPKVEKFDLYSSIKSQINSVLFKFSSKELENIIFSHLNPKAKKTFFNISVVSERLNAVESMRDLNEKLSSTLFFIASLRESNIKKVLEYFIKYSTDTQHFFILLFISCPVLYEKFVHLIFRDSFFTRIEFIRNLPSFHINLEEKELSEEVLRYLIENRPVFRSRITKHLAENKRHVLVSIIRDLYAYIDIESVGLSFEEHLNICEDNDENIHILFGFLQFFIDTADSEINERENIISKFTRLLIKKSEEHQLRFFETYYNSGSDIYRDIIIVFLKSKRLSIPLQDFFIPRFARSKEVDVNYSPAYMRDVFFLLMHYLTKEEVIESLDKYLTDEKTLRIYLKVLTANDIFYHMHYFSETKHSLQVSLLITEKREIFNETVSLETIKKMVEGPLPPLFMRTVIISLINFPFLKKSIINLMCKLVRKRIWEDSALFEGFIRCLTMLGSISAEIVMILPEDVMFKILDKNNKLVQLCYEYIQENKGVKGRSAFILKDIVLQKIKTIK